MPIFYGSASQIYIRDEAVPMSTLEAFKNNFTVARTLIVDGRGRYIGVTKTAMAIEQIYRKHRKRAKTLPKPDADKLLIEAHQKAAKKIFVKAKTVVSPMC